MTGHKYNYGSNRGIAVIGIVAVCIDIAILVTLGSNPNYSAEARWACFALVTLFSLPLLLWLFGATLSSWR